MVNVIIFFTQKILCFTLPTLKVDFNCNHSLRWSFFTHMVSQWSLSLSPSPAFFHTHFLPSDPKQLILVSSNQITLFQSSRVLSLCASANSNLALLCFWERNEHFFLTTGFIPAFLSALHIVLIETGWSTTFSSDFATPVAWSFFWEMIRQIA